MAPHELRRNGGRGGCFVRQPQPAAAAQAGRRQRKSVREAFLAVAFGAAFFWIALCVGQASAEEIPIAPNRAKPLVLPVSQGGIFDPSMADTKAGARAWMSYTAVDPSPRWPADNTRTETTRLAYSDDRGATWTDTGLRVAGIKDVAAGGKKGTWVNEVSSLVYSPEAAPAERWQLYWHHYLSFSDKGDFSHGWIGFKSADSPENLAKAKEVKLFAGRIYKAVNDDPAGETQSPLGGAPVIRLDKLNKDLEYCLVLTEPGAMAAPSGVYLALTCAEPRNRSILGMLATIVVRPQMRTILLKCDAPCRPGEPAAWRYLGALLTEDDAAAFNAIGFNAPDLFTENGKTYLLISPFSDKPVADAYNGCLVFPFADLDKAALARSREGRPLASLRIQGGPNTFNGACAYRASLSAAGFIYGEVAMRKSPFFQLYETQSRLREGSGFDRRPDSPDKRRTAF
jgi:hypothetical protein